MRVRVHEGHKFRKAALVDGGVWPKDKEILRLRAALERRLESKIDTITETAVSGRLNYLYNRAPIARNNRIGNVLKRSILRIIVYDNYAAAELTDIVHFRTNPGNGQFRSSIVDGDRDDFHTVKYRLLNRFEQRNIRTVTSCQLLPVGHVASVIHFISRIGVEYLARGNPTLLLN